MSVINIVNTFSQMIKLACQTQPIFYFSLLLIDTIQSLIPLASALITKLLFDQLAAGLQGKSLEWQDVALLLVLQAGLQIIIHALLPINSYLNADLNRRLSLKIQMTIFNKVNSLAGLAPFEDPHIRDKLQLGMQGGEIGPTKAFTTLSNLLRNTIILISFVSVLMTFNSFLAGLVVLAALPEIIVNIRLGRQRFGLTEENVHKQRRVSYFGSLLSATQIVKELRLFDLGNHFLSLFYKLSDELNASLRLQNRLELRWRFLLNLLSILVSNIAFVFVVIQAFQNRLSLGDITLYISAVGSIQGALIGIVSSLANIHEDCLYFSRYNELLALPQSIHIPSSPIPIHPLMSAIELRNVSFRYSNDLPWVLREINLTIPAGKSLALVGINGAGKTTLVKLLTRMYDPCEGEILWDGVDIRKFNPVNLRNRIGAIFQDFVHFELTAFENIIFGDLSKLNKKCNQKAEELVLQAATKAGIHKTIRGLPLGYQTTLSRWLVDNGCGVDLSGGEWQKIALARLFIRNADLLILDEPTAALDIQSEQEVYNQFVELVNGRTSIIISHRFSTVRMANIIAVIDDGRISELGSHEDLIRLGGTYFRLFETQAERYK